MVEMPSGFFQRIERQGLDGDNAGLFLIQNQETRIGVGESKIRLNKLEMNSMVGTGALYVLGNRPVRGCGFRSTAEWASAPRAFSRSAVSVSARAAELVDRTRKRPASSMVPRTRLPLSGVVSSDSASFLPALPFRRILEPVPEFGGFFRHLGQGIDPGGAGLLRHAGGQRKPRIMEDDLVAVRILQCRQRHGLIDCFGQP